MAEDTATQQLILSTLQDLQRQVAALSAVVNSVNGQVGLAEGLRESKADRARLWEASAATDADVTALDVRITALEATPGKTAITYWDRVGLGLLGLLFSAIGAIAGAMISSTFKGGSH